MIKGEIDDRQARAKLRQVAPRFLKQAAKIIEAHDRELVSHVRSRYLTGGTSATRLGVRTGRLRASTVPAPIVKKPEIVEGGIQFNTIYARTHIGPKGQETVIRPKRAKFLAIPLDAAKTRAGVARGAPRSGIWGETFVRMTDEGKLIVFGKRVVQRGERAGQARGNIVPLFLLVKQVRIPARVHPENILKWSRKRLLEEFGKGMERLG